MTAVLTTTTLDIASQNLSAYITLTFQNATMITLEFSQSELLAAATAASRSDYNTSDVLTLASAATGLTVTAAS